MWCGPLPVCLVEHHHGKVRRLRLVLATITHLTKAEINSLVEGPYLPGGTVLHDLVYGYAADASNGARVASHNRWAAARALATPSQQLGPRATLQRRKLPTLSTDAEHARAS